MKKKFRKEELCTELNLDPSEMRKTISFSNFFFGKYEVDQKVF